MTTMALSEELRSRKQKFFPKSHVFRQFFLGDSTKRFIAQPRGLQDFLRNSEVNETLCRCWRLIGDTQSSQFFQVMGVAANCPKGQIQLKKIAPHLKRTLARLPITTEHTLKCSQLLFQATHWASRSTVHFYCKCNPIKSFWKSRKRLRKPILWQFSAINLWEKPAHSQNLHQNAFLYTLLKLFFNSSDTHHFEACWTH